MIQKLSVLFLLLLSNQLANSQLANRINPIPQYSRVAVTGATINYVMLAAVELPFEIDKTSHIDISDSIQQQFLAAMPNLSDLNRTRTAPLGFSEASLVDDFYTTNGTLTGNRFVDIGTYTLSYGKGSNTNLHLFNNGNIWVGNGTPSDAGFRLQVNGNTSIHDGIIHFKTSSFATNTRIYRDREAIGYEGIVFKSAGTTGAYGTKFEFLAGFNAVDNGYNLLRMIGGNTAATYGITFGSTGIAGTKVDPNARINIHSSAESLTALSIFNGYNTTHSRTYIHFSSVGWGSGAPAVGSYIKSQGISNTYGGDLVFGINNGSAALNETDVLTIHRSGNVLIGTATNDGINKFQINGRVRISGLTTDNTQQKIVVSDVNGNLFLREASTIEGGGSSNSWQLSGSNLFNANSGFVGIGTSTPQSELAVKGTITAKKIKVTQAGWPDYVFAPDYQLTSYRELELFIRKNHHLPGVVSAKEVEKNGLDVGDNQAVLLQKIEELTLYIIDLNKRMEQLERENKEMKKKSNNEKQ